MINHGTLGLPIFFEKPRQHETDGSLLILLLSVTVDSIDLFPAGWFLTRKITVPGPSFNPTWNDGSIYSSEDMKI